MKRLVSNLKFWILLLAVVTLVSFLLLRPKAPRRVVVQNNDMLKVADVKVGERLAHSCMACHNFVPGATAKRVGPNLFGIVGAPIGGRSGFAYSQALMALNKQGAIWTTDDLYEWLRDPSHFAPGTIMSYEGMLDPQDRMDLIAYLMTLK